MNLTKEMAFLFLYGIVLYLSLCKAYVMGEQNIIKQDHSEVTIHNLQVATNRYKSLWEGEKKNHSVWEEMIKGKTVVKIETK